MTKKVDKTKAAYFKRLLDQMAGNPSEDHPLIPEYCISGEGDMWCYDPADRNFKRVARGTIVYILKEDYDYKGRILVYTMDGLTVCVDPDDLFVMGLN